MTHIYEITLKIVPNITTVTAANRQHMTVRGATVIKIQISTLIDNINFLVIDELGMDIIIGNDQLKAWNAKINYEDETVELGMGIIVPINI